MFCIHKDLNWMNKIELEPKKKKKCHIFAYIGYPQYTQNFFFIYTIHVILLIKKIEKNDKCI